MAYYFSFFLIVSVGEDGADGVATNKVCQGCENDDECVVSSIDTFVNFPMSARPFIKTYTYVYV